MINSAVINNFEDNTQWGIITSLLHGKTNMYVYKIISLSWDTHFFLSLFSLTLELAKTWGGKVILQLLSPVSHVNTSLGWIVPPDNSDNTGRTHFPVSLT